MSKLCWLCGDPAITGEHKVKRSDLTRVHGRGPKFASANLEYLRSDGSIVKLPGPNSAHLKYPDALCAACNSTRTQPFDRAYDQFAVFVEDNAQHILTRRRMDFEDIFGTDWREKQGNLFKYFAKSFGCRIVNADKRVPADLRAIVDCRNPQIPFFVCFAVDEDEVEKPPEMQTRLGIGNLIHSEGNAPTVRYAAATRYRWLLTTYWFNWGPYGPVGEPWCPIQRVACLGSYAATGACAHVQREDGTLVRWPGFEI